MEARPLPHQLGRPGAGSAISSAAAPAQWSAVTLRMQLPEVWMACISTSASVARMSARVLELDPVELDVLPRGEMAVAAVILLGDLGELAHLPRRQRAIGNGDAQHIGVELQIEAVHQPQRPELVLGQRAPRGGAAPGRETARCARRRSGGRIHHSDTWCITP